MKSLNYVLPFCQEVGQINDITTLLGTLRVPLHHQIHLEDFSIGSNFVSHMQLPGYNINNNQCTNLATKFY